MSPHTQHHPPGALQALQLVRRKALDATEAVSLAADCHHPAEGREILRVWASRSETPPGIGVTQSAFAYQFAPQGALNPFPVKLPGRQWPTVVFLFGS